MAFNQPQSGWTAMGISPDPDKFAAAYNNINRVSSGVVAPAPVAAPLPLAPTAAYQQLQSQIFGGAPTNPLAAQQLQAAQATAAPANAFAAVEKSLKADPWVKPLATAPEGLRPPQSGFLNPTVTKPTTPPGQSGWVPSNSLPTI